LTGTVTAASTTNPIAGRPQQCPAFAEPPLRISGDADRYYYRDGNDDHTQPGNLFRLLNIEQKQRLFGNIARHMTGVPKEIQLRQIRHFLRADPAYGMGVTQALNLDIREFMAKASGTQPSAPTLSP
jgi:catalase